MPSAPSSKQQLGQADTWQRKISAAWQKSVEAIIETGLLLIDARHTLEHGQFIKMVESELPFKRGTAHALMTIAADKRISNVEHVQRLPASWGTLYQLTGITDNTFGTAIENGTINPRMKRKDAIALLPPPKPRAPNVTAPQDEAKDNDTPEQRWQRSIGNHAGEAIALRAFLTREFANWEHFARPSSLRTLARQAANAWTELADELEKQPQDGKAAGQDGNSP
jgi:hypothetical protein